MTGLNHRPSLDDTMPTRHVPSHRAASFSFFFYFYFGPPAR